MRKIIVTASLLFFAACASDPVPVIWHCTCQTTCSGQTQPFEADACDSEALDTQVANDNANTACLSGLVEAGCTSPQCACSCNATETECSL